MGRVSREARLLFVQLWTVCDDAGRTRAASRMLASLLYPYDDDAPKRIDGWLKELERERCVIRYQADGGTYLQVCNWLSHQKIDKPSKSKIPEFANIREDSPKAREDSSGDLDLDLDQRTKGRDQSRGASKTRPTRKAPEDFAITPNLREWAAEKAPGVDVDRATEAFRDHTFARAITDWPGAWRNWMRREKPMNGHRLTKYEQSMSRLAASAAAEPPPITNPMARMLLESKP